MSHTFHIPVLGLAYSVDTPIKVAHYGISSVASIVDDILLERMRKCYLEKSNQIFVPIEQSESNFRAKRITAYLNLMQRIIKKQFDALKAEDFESGKEINKYFDLLPEHCLHNHYHTVLN